VTERRFDCLSGEWRSFVTNAHGGASVPAERSCAICGPDGAAVTLGLRTSGSEYAVFDDERSSLLLDPSPRLVLHTPLAPVGNPSDASEIVVWSDDHRLELTDLTVDRLAGLIEVWAERFAELKARPDVGYVLVLEDKPVGRELHDHPHCEIRAEREIPPRVRHNLEVAAAYLEQHGRCLRCDVGAQAVAARNRVVADDSRMLAFIPFAARFPYEVHIQPRRHATSLLDLSDAERLSLAAVLHDVLTSYDGLFHQQTPYALALHQAPTDDGDWFGASHLHVEIRPLIGRLGPAGAAESLAGTYSSDVLPEVAARALRERAAR